MKNRIAIVTGVSRIQGIGRAICIELARRGCDIFFTYWSSYDEQMPWGVEMDEPDRIKKEIAELGVQCASLELDLTLDGSIEKLYTKVNSDLGPPSILVNNATYSTDASIYNLTPEDLDRHYQVNVKATTFLIAEFVKNFDLGVHGRVVNMTSGQSIGHMPDEIAYAITKGTVETLTKNLFTTLASKGITINAVNPGPNDTGWMDDEFKEELKMKFPMKRIGMPTDAAKLVGFLSSEDAEWITGQVIHSEGGFDRQL